MGGDHGIPTVVVAQPGRQVLTLMVDRELTVGRECEGLILADSQVSRRHLQMVREGPTVRCTDLGSTNGTLLDGVPLTAPTLLEPGSVLTLGSTTVRLHQQAPKSGIGRETTIRAVDLAQTSIDVVAGMVASDEWRPRVDAGTVTILFSDIESHTQMVTRLGDAAWFDVLERHNAAFRNHLGRLGGREVKSQGDGFMLTFPSVRRALSFAAAVQHELGGVVPSGEDRPVSVRMGMHTGEVITDSAGDLFGRHVIKAARIANLASGGQVLVSGTVREIASGDSDWSFGDPVEVELAGLDHSHAVHEFFWSEPA